MNKIKFDSVNDGDSFSRSDFTDFVMKKMDLNDSGKINGDEIAALAAGMKGVTKEDLLKFDKNDDGKLSRKELKKAMREVFEDADANGDGKLSKSEAKDFFDFKEARKALEQIEDGDGDEIEDKDDYDVKNSDNDAEDLPGLGEDADLEDAFGKFNSVDANDDGEVTAEELAKKAFKRFDENDNGKLSESEAKDMLEALDIDPDRYDDIAGEDGKISKADLTKFLQNEVVDELGDENDGESLTKDEFQDM